MASEAGGDLGFMARLLALCSLPRTDPHNRKEYVRRNGPYTLAMNAGSLQKLPYDSQPRLILSWLCTEVVRTGSCEIVLWKSLSEFMNKLGSGSRRRGGQPAPQSNEAALRLQCDVDLRE